MHISRYNLLLFGRMVCTVYSTVEKKIYVCIEILLMYIATSLPLFVAGKFGENIFGHCVLCVLKRHKIYIYNVDSSISNVIIYLHCALARVGLTYIIVVLVMKIHGILLAFSYYTVKLRSCTFTQTMRGI